jgi:hypothetical protein
MSGFMNKQNCRYWAPNNPHECQQRLPHNAKVTAWCSICSHGINGPPFFKNAGRRHTVTLNTEWYKVIMETFLQNWLYPCQVDLVCFQQDGATAHMAQMQSKSQYNVSRQTHFLFWGTSPGSPAHLIMQH